MSQIKEVLSLLSSHKKRLSLILYFCAIDFELSANVKCFNHNSKLFSGCGPPLPTSPAVEGSAEQTIRHLGGSTWFCWYRRQVSASGQRTTYCCWHLQTVTFKLFLKEKQYMGGEVPDFGFYFVISTRERVKNAVVAFYMLSQSAGSLKWKKKRILIYSVSRIFCFLAAKEVLFLYYYFIFGISTLVFYSWNNIHRSCDAPVCLCAVQLDLWTMCTQQ